MATSRGRGNPGVHGPQSAPRDAPSYERASAVAPSVLFNTAGGVDGLAPHFPSLRRTGHSRVENTSQ
jgi:hypothetical protein